MSCLVLIFSAALFLFMAAGKASEILPSCWIFNTTLPTYDASVNVSCTTVVFSNVVVQGSMMLNISIAGMVMANPKASHLDVNLTNVSLKSGAILAIDGGGGYRGATGGEVMVSVIIQGLSGNESCLLFSGSFPFGTSIFVSDAHMTSTEASPLHSEIDPYRPMWRKVVLLAAIVIKSKSSLRFENSSFRSSTVNERAVTVPFYIVDVEISAGSFLSFNNCSISATNGSAFVASGSVVFTDHSYMTVSSCVVTSQGPESGYYAFDISENALFLSRSTMTFSLCTITSAGGNALRIFNATFADWSSLNVSSCNMSSSLASAFTGSNLMFSDSSCWICEKCSFTSLASAFGFSDATVTLQNRSSWKIHRSSFVGLVALGFASSRLRLQRDSIWEVSESSFLASSTYLTSGGLFFSKNIANTIANRSMLELVDRSAWIILSCAFDGSYASSAILFSDVDVLIQNGSFWNMSRCTATSHGRRSEGSLVFFRSTLTIQQSSEFKIFHSAFTAAASSGLSFTERSVVNVQQLSVFVIDNSMIQGSSTALTISADSTIRLEQTSAWVITSGTFFSSNSESVNPTAAVHLIGSLAVARSSMFALRGNVFSLLSSAVSQRCIDLANLTIAERSVAEIVENDCTGGADSTPFLSAERGNYWGLVQRCNRVNGAVWIPEKNDDMVSLPCGFCDRSVDCFWPLTEPAQFTRIQCDGVRSCPCIKACGGQEDFMCLPGTGTIGLDGSVSPRSCSSHNNMEWPRLRTTMTMSWNATVTAGFTLSDSQKQPPDSQVVAAMSSASSELRTATVAFASTAIFLSGSSGAGMIQRMQAQQLLNTCGGDGSVDFSSSPTQMHFGSTDDGYNMSYVRGGAVGNLLLWLVCVVVACSLAKIVQLRRAIRGGDNADRSWVACATDLGLPGRMNRPYNMLSVPTLTSSVMLLVPSRVTGTVQPGDAVLGVLGVIVCLIPATCKAFVATRRPFPAVPVERAARSSRYSASKSVGGYLLERYKRRIQADLLNRWEWVDRPGGTNFVKRWGGFFGSCGRGRQWFPVVDLTASIIIAVLAGLMPLDHGNGDLCHQLQVLSAVVAVTFLASLVLLRPHGSPMLRRFATCNAVITAVSSVLGACGVDTAILTAVQAFLNGISTLALFGILLLGGVFFQSLLFLTAIIAGSVPRETLSRGPEGRDLSRGSLPSTATQGRQPFIHPAMLQRMVAGLPSPPAEQHRVLEELISIICQTQSFRQVEHLL